MKNALSIVHGFTVGAHDFSWEAIVSFVGSVHDILGAICKNVGQKLKTLKYYCWLSSYSSLLDSRETM